MESEDAAVPGSRRIHPLIRILVWMGVIPVGVSAAIYGVALVLPAKMAPYERTPAASLKTVASAQADFRGNDRDNNGIQDYWRGDVAGLYALKPEGVDDAIKLIELSIAGADAAPVTDITLYTIKSPKAGHWYKALRFPDEDPAKPDPRRFAACAFPSSAAAGRMAFIISHENTMYRRAWAGPQDTPSVYPADPEKEGWSKLD